MRKVLLVLCLLGGSDMALAMKINGQLEGALAEKLAANPTGTEARFYYNTVDKSMKLYNGTSWLQIADTASAIVNPMDSAGDMIYGATAGVATKLDNGASKTLLQANGAAAPTWVSTVGLAAGTAAAPSFSFSGDPDTGLYSAGANQLGAAVNGAEYFEVNTGGVLLTQTGTQIRGAAGAGGTATTPDFSWAGDTNTGMYSDAADRIRWTAGGDLKMTLNNAGGTGQYRLDLSSTNAAILSGVIMGRIRTITDDPDSDPVAAEDRVVSNTATGSSSRREWYLSNSGVSTLVMTLEESGNLALTGITTGDTFAANPSSLVGLTDHFHSRRNTYSVANGHAYYANDTDSAVDSGNEIVHLEFSADGDATNGTYISFQDSGGEIGSINASSATTVAFNTTSDQRLKKNGTAMTDGVTRVKAMTPRYFEWTEDDHADEGFYAQELAAYAPHAVTGDPNGNVNTAPMQIDYSKLTPVLTAALKEVITRLETIEADYAAYKVAHP